MATFIGTEGQDTFVGSTTEQNFFNFLARELNSFDIVTGNPNAGLSDFIVFNIAGNTVFAPSFSGVTHVEAIVLNNGITNSIALLDSMVASADTPIFTVFEDGSVSLVLDT